MRRSLILLGPLVALALSSCAKDPFIVKRSPCPAVAVPQYAGDVTRFQPADSRDATAIDVSATLTRVGYRCNEGEGGGDIASTVGFTVVGTRRAAGPARAVELPVFVAVVRAGDTLISKTVTPISLVFAEGAVRAEAQGSAIARIARNEAALPGDIAQAITRERKPGEADAAIDPLSEPKVREAVRRASFEVLVGFQLSEAELAYNVAR